MMMIPVHIRKKILIVMETASLILTAMAIVVVVQYMMIVGIVVEMDLSAITLKWLSVLAI